MPADITGYRVFIATPGGLAAERRRFRTTLVEYNDDDAVARGITFLPIGWEDTLSGVGRPQELINEDVRRADYLVLVLWDRWGTPPSTGAGTYTSGTEEEYSVARECLADATKAMRKVVVLFKGVDERQLSDPGEQLQRVLAFRRQIEAEKVLLYQTFDTEDEFQRVLRKHLAQWVRDHESAKVGTPIPLPAQGNELSAPQEAVHDKQYPSLDALLSEAESLAGSGRHVDAEALFARAIVGSRSVTARLRYGRFLRRSDRLAHARVIYQSALDIAVEEDDAMYEAEALANLGVIDRRTHQLEAAAGYLKRAQDAVSSLDESANDLRAFIVGNLAQLSADRGDFEMAEDLQRQALALQESPGREEDVANSYGTLGVILRRRHRWAEAEQAHLKGIEISESLGEQGKRTLAYNCGSLGLVYEKTQRYVEAADCHGRALEMHKQLAREEGEALNLGHLASALIGAERFDEAEQSNEAAFAINSRRGNPEGVAYNYSTRGRISEHRDSLDDAARYFRTSSELFQQVNHPVGVAFNLHRLGAVLMRQGKEPEAREALRRAEQVATEAGEPELLANIRAESAKLSAGNS